MSIYQKLVDVQSTLSAPKNQRNDFGKYNYRSCEDIFEALKPLLRQARLALIVTDSVELIGERQYIKATAKLFDADTGETLETSAFAREEDTKKGMDASQVSGAASSYARKYALNGMFAIDDNKDSDATNTHGKEQNAPQQKKAEPKKAVEIMCEGCQKPFTDFVSSAGKEMTPAKWTQMSSQYYGKILCKSCMASKQFPIITKK